MVGGGEAHDVVAFHALSTQYTSPVLKQWSALVRQYEKNNVFAAEAARIIAQNTAFEMYALRFGVTVIWRRLRITYCHV